MVLAADRRTAMISNDVLSELTIGTVIKSDVPKRKWDYMSYKNRNGKADQTFSLRERKDAIDWLFIGVNFVGRKMFLKCVEKEPIFSIEFRGGVGSFYCEKELNSIVRYWFGRKFCYPRSIRVEDINLLLGIEVEPSNKRYTFKKGDYSPGSFAKHRVEYEGTRVKHLSYSYNRIELPISPATEIVFLDKPYWLASKTVSVERDCAYFGLGEVTSDGCVNMGHSLFKSTGETLGGTNTAYVRSLVYIDPKSYSLIKLNSGAYRLVES